jgi:shikimate kinase
MKHHNIFLVGPMGSGKTTIGKELARALGKEFVDSDQEIERRTGATIPLIFELEGETGFRSREQQVIDELTQRDNIVLATGGGAVLDPENRKHLAARGFVVYLRASVEQLHKRTRKDAHRPLLNTADPKQRLRDLIQQRGALYEEIADVTLDTDNVSPKALAAKIRKRLAE